MPEMRQSSLVVVANRLPIDDNQAPDGACEWRRSPGGLVSALHPLLRHTPATWVGWAGGTGPAPALPDVDGVRMHTVALSPEDLRDHYEGFANATLWPLYHDSVEQPQHHRRWWEAYQRVNQRFAEATAEVAEPGAVIWVQDYHLQLVPGQLRALRPDLRIGFFLHVPFPPPELFMQLPRRAELLRGMLGADLVGFQRVQAAHNFAQLVTRVLELPATDRRIGIDDRVVRIGAFPVSIDTAEMAALADRPDVAARAHRLRQDLGDPRQVILSVDRMDYTKGIEQRLKAYSELLASGDVKVRDTVLVQVAMPSRERVGQYQILRERIEREVGRINGEFGRVGEPAIHYLTQPFDRAELAALYRVADVMAVTPLRDGMNLVAKEYVAARVDDTGALLLSEFAGTAAELSQAYLVNPHDLEGLKQGLRAALRASPADTTQRMRAMRAHLHQHDIRAWARSYLRALDEGGALISRLTSTETGSEGTARVPRPVAPTGSPAVHQGGT
ncbi:trehalose-6-phosphate synthase [Micromonospora sp. M51]|nr:trehalose-6-phosphate synthase [Micromonospora sp. M51]MBQ1033965.1 trehalose-6-phosphate synthase [Micromonospora sp. C97]